MHSNADIKKAFRWLNEQIAGPRGKIAELPRRKRRFHALAGAISRQLFTPHTPVRPLTEVVTSSLHMREIALYESCVSY